jgi:hypothetical protein
VTFYVIERISGGQKEKTTASQVNPLPQPTAES